MDSRTFLIFNLVLVILLIVFFIKGTKRDRPSRLNLKGKKKLPQNENSPNENGPRTLNILFEFQGRTYDVFNVLEVPAGAPKNLVEQAYTEKKNKPGNDKKLIQTAYEKYINWNSEK